MGCVGRWRLRLILSRNCPFKGAASLKFTLPPPGPTVANDWSAWEYRSSTLLPQLGWHQGSDPLSTPEVGWVPCYSSTTVQYLFVPSCVSHTTQVLTLRILPNLSAGELNPRWFWTTNFLIQICSWRWRSKRWQQIYSDQLTYRWVPVLIRSLVMLAAFRPGLISLKVEFWWERGRRWTVFWWVGIWF